MKLDLNDITFIIVTYQSENIVKNCLDSLPKVSKKIIIENSNDINLEKDLRSKYDNIEVILSNNIGMGAGNNIGLKECKTNYAYVLNPDTKLKKDTLLKSSRLILLSILYSIFSSHANSTTRLSLKIFSNNFAIDTVINGSIN